MICLPATVKDEPSMLLGKSTHPRAQYIPSSHTNEKIIAPLITSFALYWIIMSSLSTGSFPSVYKHVITSLSLKRKLVLNPTSASSCCSISFWNPIRSLSLSLFKENLQLSKSPMTSTCCYSWHFLILLLDLSAATGFLKQLFIFIFWDIHSTGSPPGSLYSFSTLFADLPSFSKL